jgi:hypothetical protein
MFVTKAVQDAIAAKNKKKADEVEKRVKDFKKMKFPKPKPKKIVENEILMYKSGEKHLKTYLNLMKMKRANGQMTPADEEMEKLAQKHHAGKILKNVLTSKNIKENAPTNCVGSGSIAAFDPKLGGKKVLKRYKDVVRKTNS